jgi:hypothetical protein
MDRHVELLRRMAKRRRMARPPAAESQMEVMSWDVSMTL